MMNLLNEESAFRTVQALADGWVFLPDKPQKAWLLGSWPQHAQAITLPHCWNEKDTFQQGLRYRQGDGFYGCRFTLPDAPPDILWQLRSGGFYGTGEVWLNGQRIARVDGQYLGFTLDVSPHLNKGQPNILTVALNNRFHPHVLPGKKMPDFLLHGGLAGEITLHALPRVHLDDQTLGVLCHRASEAAAEAELRATVHNPSGSAIACRIRATIHAGDARVVHTQDFDPGRIAPNSMTPAIFPFTLERPHLWHVNDPHLYTLRAELLMDDRVIDAADKRFGARTAVFDGKQGFLLNGKPLYLQGVNRHECVPGFGNALPPSLHGQDAEQIKSLGMNLVRLAHYPQHPAFLDACDEAGVLVYAEIASWKSARPGPWARAAYRQLTAMVERDRHHPSIILWGLANESRSRIAFKRMTRLLEHLDPTRETIYAENHLHRGRRWRTLKAVDVLGVNYELDRLADARAVSRKGAVLISEMSNCARTRRGDLAAEANQAATYHRDFARIEKAGGAAGYTLWSYNDYPTQRKQRIIRRPGVVDAWRLPKIASAYLQARTLAQPVLRVYGDWGRTGPAEERAIHIVTNCERIQVRSNGETLLERDGALLLSLTLPFRDASLDVIGLQDGKEVVSDRLSPFGPAVRLLLVPEQPSGTAKDRSCIGVLVQAVDEQGEPDRSWTESVRIRIDGPARARCYTEDDQVEMGAGVGRFFVTGTGETGDSTLRALHDNLTEGSASVEWQ